jgi:hypothetical protein
MYTGGVEHAILHLLYARFFTKVLRDLGFVEGGEPFVRMRNQGMILGADGEKMSKSRGNVANPDGLVASYGADAVRAYLMFIGPWDQGGPWNYQGIEGVTRFLNRVWALIVGDGEARRRRARRGRPQGAPPRGPWGDRQGHRPPGGLPLQHRGGRAHDAAERHDAKAKAAGAAAHAGPGARPARR